MSTPLFQMFDYETVTSYFLRVTASNVEPPYFNMSADITVTIRDTNDNPPVFSMPGGYIITVPEAAIVSRPVGTVVATDEDGGINSTVSSAHTLYCNIVNICLCSAGGISVCTRH